MKLDSLEYEQAIRDQYFENLKRIISGEMPENLSERYFWDDRSTEITFLRSTNDSLLRQQVEAEEQFRLSVLDEPCEQESVRHAFLHPGERNYYPVI